MSTVIGQRFGRRRIPWNREKSIVGSAALFLRRRRSGRRARVVVPACRSCRRRTCGSRWARRLPPRSSPRSSRRFPSGSTTTCRSPARPRRVLWALSLVSADRVACLHGCRVALRCCRRRRSTSSVAWLGYRARTVTHGRRDRRGGHRHADRALRRHGRAGLLLVATFLAAAVTSRLGVQRKTLLGIAEERGGRRGAGNAIANTGLRGSGRAALRPDVRTRSRRWSRSPRRWPRAAAIPSPARSARPGASGRIWCRRCARWRPEPPARSPSKARPPASRVPRSLGGSPRRSG